MIKYMMGVVLLLATSSAMAGGVVVTSPKNAVASLDQEGVRKVFLGREPTAVVVFSNSAVRNSFETNVLGKAGSDLKSFWSRLVFTGRAKAPEEKASDAEVKAFVSGNPNAYGYIDESAVDGTVKVLYRFQ